MVRGEYGTKQISLNPGCGFETGDVVYQVKRADGVIELIPEKVFNMQDFY